MSTPEYWAHVRPSARQLRWQRMELYGFIHFGMNTMTDREWGDGTEDPAWFDPAAVDTDQWVAAARAAGMRGLILTCKHHDGFSLWPTAQSSHSVAASPWRGGHGDLVAEVARSCAEGGLAFGIYLSPWDRAEPSYGSGAPYDDFFVAQLTELLTGYGDVFSVWFDGANGERSDGRRQDYDWDRYYRVVRSLQPEAVISVCGPDVRWCGNEAGHTRLDEWSVVPHQLRAAERTADRSQQVDDGRFSRAVRSDDQDLGSHAVLAAYDGEPVWYPAEVNTSLRPGWFHHPSEDGEVRSPEELFDIYRRSVGGNATLLLNIPPNRDGLVDAPDVAALEGLGVSVREWWQRDVGGAADVEVSSGGATGGQPLPWRPADTDERPEIRLRWPSPVRVDAVAIGEDVAHGQRIEGVEIRVGDRVVATARSVGHLRIIDLPTIDTDALSVVVTGCRATPVLSRLAVIAAPDHGGGRP